VFLAAAFEKTPLLESLSQACQRAGFDLTHALAGKTHAGADLSQRVRLFAAKAETPAQHLLLPLRQVVEDVA